MQTYKATLPGTTRGAKTGQMYRFDGGDEFDAPAGEFDHDDNVNPVKGKQTKDGGDSGDGSAKPTNSNTVAEIKSWLDEQEIEYTADHRKADLLELVENA